MNGFISRSTRRDRVCLSAAAVGWILIAIFGTAPGFAQTPEAPTAAADSMGSTQQWPLHIDTASGAITVYQPQMTNFDGNKLTARAAVSVVPPGQQDPTFGALWMESRVSTDRVARTVQIQDITVTKTRFPDAQGPTEQTLTNVLRTTLPQQPMTLSLDQLLSMMEVVEKEKQAVKDISTSPPKILFKSHAAVLVQFDGDPRLEAVDNSSVLRAVNTPFFVALDPQSKQYFLKGGGQWFAAPQPIGPYQNVPGAPPAIAQLADTSGYKDPQQALSPSQAAGIEIVTATEPSELLWTDGAEQMAPLNNTNLLYVTNTDCDIFLSIDSQQIFVLVSGRWFTAPHKAGPWAYVAPDKLPADFSRIEPQSPKGEVLAHIANTQEAKDAVADTFVPQTAAINRQNFEAPDVQYDGDPQFQPVESTSMSYAVNSPNSVVLVDRQYYCCSNAVWYVSGAPRGPWGLCDRVPEAIYTIPPSCPVYPCRYVYVYDETPDVVYCGYLPGYVGCYHYDGVVVYGTGYIYRPWVGHAFYPRPYTYGFAAHYDDYRNHWGFSIGLAFGSGAAWVGDRPYESRHDDWFGHGGYRPAIIERNRTTNIYRTNVTNINVTNVNVNRTDIRNTQYNVYDRRKDVRYDQNARPEVRTPARVDHPAEVAHRDAAPAARGEPARPAARDNVFADSNGNVYRKTADGWDRRDNNQWKASEPTRSEPAQKETPRAETPRDASPRDESPKTAAEPKAQRPADVHAESPRAETPQRSAKPDDDRAQLDRDYKARAEGERRASDADRGSAKSEAPHESEQPHQAEEPRGSAQPSERGGNSGGNSNGNQGGRH